MRPMKMECLDPTGNLYMYALYYTYYYRLKDKNDDLFVIKTYYLWPWNFPIFLQCSYCDLQRIPSVWWMRWKEKEMNCLLSMKPFLFLFVRGQRSCWCIDAFWLYMCFWDTNKRISPIEREAFWILRSFRSKSMQTIGSTVAVVAVQAKLQLG